MAQGISGSDRFAFGQARSYLPVMSSLKRIGLMKSAQPMSATIRQIEFELEKAKHGMAMPYDAERVAHLRDMLREARKHKLSAGLRARREGHR
jgi:hypothetical protein